MIPRLPSFLSFLLRRSLPNDYLTIQLERACREDICPICIFDGESRYTWLWSFLWEHVNDPDARSQFISAGGLCPADLWRAVELARHVIKSSLGVAMVFQHLVKIITRALETGRSSAPWISSSPWRFDLGSGCQACATAESAAGYSGTRLLLAASVPTPPRWLESAFLLCGRHFQVLVSRASSSESRIRLYNFQDSAAKAQGMPSSARRLEAAVKPLPAFFPVPVKSESLYEKASERCPVCKRMTRLEKDSSSPSSTTLHSCLAHYRAFAGVGTAIYARFAPEEESQAVTQRSDCPSCSQRQELESQALDYTVSQIQERGAQDLLCLSHLTRVLAMLPRDRGAEFLQDQLDCLNTLIKDLDDFIALHDYRYGKQPAENPDSPYRWALRFLSSEPSIYAHLLTPGGSEKFLRSKRRRRASLPNP